MVYKIELKYRFKQKAKSEALVRTFKNSLKLSLLSLRSLEKLIKTLHLNDLYT